MSERVQSFETATAKPDRMTAKIDAAEADPRIEDQKQRDAAWDAMTSGVDTTIDGMTDAIAAH